MAREGARVAVAHRAEADAAATVALINAAGGQATAIGGDVTREADVTAMVARTVSAFGRIDRALGGSIAHSTMRGSRRAPSAPRA
jgi:NAD(P)-dependent dehydrogenase (short-subunit alcohol dehydrogenase family)